MNIFSRFFDGRKIRKLEQEYLRQCGLAGPEAQHSLQRQVERLQTSRPGKSRLWYLEKVLYDLQRDRRRS